MYMKTVVYANSASAAAELLSEARRVSAEVCLVTSNADLKTADQIFCVPAGGSLCEYMPAIINLLTRLQPCAVLCEAGADGKLFAGFAAAALKASPVCDINYADFYSDFVETKRIVYGGTAVMTQQSRLPAVIVAALGLFEASEIEGAGNRIDLELTTHENIYLRESCAGAEPLTASLSAAKKVIGVGRGLCSAENIPALEALAAALGAEIGCTRPVAEEEHWFARDRYIGVSGCKLKPSFYLAIGISGQVQHMVGINQAGTIFAINKDEQSPIFSQADYCLQGDINILLPKLLAYFA